MSQNLPSAAVVIGALRVKCSYEIFLTTYRSKELESGGGAAALQGVGIQAVVTEFLILYAELIFSDKMPSYSSPELKSRSPLSINLLLVLLCLPPSGLGDIFFFPGRPSVCLSQIVSAL